MRKEIYRIFATMAVAHRFFLHARTISGRQAAHPHRRLCAAKCINGGLRIALFGIHTAPWKNHRPLTPERQIQVPPMVSRYKLWMVCRSYLWPDAVESRERS
ncbi:MAG: hypothetical protein WCD04_20465 [Terriglobia bacterium]|jgi:hypothetical protein